MLTSISLFEVDHRGFDQTHGLTHASAHRLHADVYHTHDLTGPGMLFVITEGHSILATKKAEHIKFYIALGISLNVFEVMVCCRLCNGYLISRSLVQNMTCRNIKMLMLQQSLWKNISEFFLLLCEIILLILFILNQTFLFI